jgi:hypothetical protein
VVGEDLNVGDGFSFFLVDAFPSGPFVVTVAGSVVVAGALDFEATPMFTLTVSVNETGTGRPCTLSSWAVVVVNIVDVAEAPVVVAAPLVASVGEGDTWPCRPQPGSWFGSSGPGNGSAVVDGPCNTTALGYGYVLAVDPASANTSMVRVEVVRVEVEVEVEVESPSAEGRFPSSAPWLALVAGGGGQCVGGVPCEFVISPSSPAWDYDTGLRGLRVWVVATGSTGLASSVVVEVTVRARNEGRVCGGGG